jgi:indolepyruvate ferredoxin oxidoreductase alpha subunit
MKHLMTGNEAVARGVFEAGVTYASAYPGTPSTEILENVGPYKEHITAEWAANEKVALETAIGASVAGARSFAAMKHECSSRSTVYLCLYRCKWGFSTCISR